MTKPIGALFSPPPPPPVVVTGTAPVISGMVAPQVSMTQGAPPLWQINVADTNSGATVSATITISGAAGTLSHIGAIAPNGGPVTYGFAATAMSPAEMTAALRNLLWLPSATTPGTITTFSVTVTNSLGISATASNTITNVAPAAMPVPLTPVVAAAALPRHFKGLNLAGGENWPDPSFRIYDAQYSWAASVGLRTIRLPFLFSHMTQVTLQHAQLFANFNTEQLNGIVACVERARANGQYCVLDDHSYGGILNPFNTGTADDQGFIFWNDVRAPKEGFADCWKRMAIYFDNYPNILFGVQNEPGIDSVHFHPLRLAAQAAIRSVTTTKYIIYPGIYSNVYQFDYPAFAGFTDSGPFMIEVHCYFDGHGGTQWSCDGSTPQQAFDGFTAWCRTNGYKAFCGEWAYGIDTSCNTIGPSIPAYFTTNADVWLGWTWWGGGDFPDSYPFYMDHAWWGIPPQVAALQANLADTF